jgi:hypothetical protein
MDPFARKMVVGSLAFGCAMLLMAAALAVVYFHMHPQCSEQVLAEAISPDKRWIAAALERRCGGNAPFLLHVNLRPAEQPIRLGYFSGHASEGEIFLVEEDTPADVPQLEWRSPDRLDIRCARCSSAFARTMNQRWQSVSIRYAPAR